METRRGCGGAVESVSALGARAGHRAGPDGPRLGAGPACLDVGRALAAGGRAGIRRRPVPARDRAPPRQRQCLEQSRRCIRAPWLDEAGPRCVPPRPAAKARRFAGVPECPPGSIGGRGCSAGARRLPGPVRMTLRWLPPGLIVVVTLAAFSPTLGNGFASWDDALNFLDNPYYRGLAPAQLRWMFTTFHVGHYMPLTWLTLGLDYSLWGLHPAGYHFTSLLLHTATALAFYFLALRLLQVALPPATTPVALRWGAALAALVFAVHPLRVESVASATERRDVLSGLFYVLALLCYVKAATASAETAPARLEPRWYALALASFAAALLSKSIVVTLPVTLLVLDVYPLRRLGGAAGWRAPRPWLDKLPFFALSAAATIVAFLALLPLGNTRSLADLGIGARIFLSMYGLAFYVFKTLAPLDLSPLYPLTVTITWWHFAVVIAATVLAVSMRRRWPAFTAAWLIYAITLGPVLGFFHNGPQAVADRYTYLACLG